jgi:hypothetical protein
MSSLQVLDSAIDSREAVLHRSFVFARPLLVD